MSEKDWGLGLDPTLVKNVANHISVREFEHILAKIPPLCDDKTVDRTTVVVAMSGGVDSSVVAAILCHLGYKVIGATMRLYSEEASINKKKACCAGLDIYDASRVAQKMGFSHYVLDYEKIFAEAVIGNFVSEYKAGRTPIPCITCNQTVKFRDMYKFAKDIGADALATGHYIRCEKTSSSAGGNEYGLYTAVDNHKDQSYFLYSIKREQLGFVKFPLGGLNKTQTRKLASFLELDVKDKPESQDICFVKDGSYRDLLKKISGESRPGDFISTKGEILGKHNGITGFTVGQRRGIGISGKEPYYVVKINASENTVTLGSQEDLMINRVKISQPNWLADVYQGQKVSIRLRSSQKNCGAIVQALGEQECMILLDQPSVASAAGQALVIYDGQRILGGGVIEEQY